MEGFRRRHDTSPGLHRKHPWCVLDVNTNTVGFINGFNERSQFFQLLFCGETFERTYRAKRAEAWAQNTEYEYFVTS